MAYTEAKYENAVIEVFRDALGYDYAYGPNVARYYAESLYLDVLTMDSDFQQSAFVNLDTYVKREFKKLYIAYKADTNFVDDDIQNSRLRLAINMKFADVKIGLDSLNMLDDVMEIIEQAFRMQDVG